MPKGARVVVIECGVVGLVTMGLAMRRGGRRLLLSDPIEGRRAMARGLGASTVIDPTREDLRERVMALTRGRGADVVCEAVGKPEVLDALQRLEAQGQVFVSGRGREENRIVY